MLADEGGDPEIVGGNGRALVSQLGEESGVMMRGLLVSIEHADQWGVEKFGEEAFILRGPGATGKSSPQFGQHYEWDDDLAGVPDDRHGLGTGLRKGHIGIGIDG